VKWKVSSVSSAFLGINPGSKVSAMFCMVSAEGMCLRIDGTIIPLLTGKVLLRIIF